MTAAPTNNETAALRTLGCSLRKKYNAIAKKKSAIKATTARSTGE